MFKYEKNFLVAFNLIDYQKSIYDMQNEKDYLNHYKKFLHILDFEELFWKIVVAALVFGISNNNVFFYNW